MTEIIETDLDLCTGCNRCVRDCPMEMANITYQDKDGNIKVKVDNTKCISCGRCLTACHHNARHYKDDIKLFLSDLKGGVPISLIVAPSVRTNIPEYKKLFSYFKKLGVKQIYDVSLGADICIWGHVMHIREKGAAPMITQPCPVIVTYCQIYRHDLLPLLSPIQSPMACAALYMKKYKGINDRIAALSPCVAKKNEFRETNLADYNITFSSLSEYLEKNNIALPEEKTEFDNIESGLGTLFPMPGGLKENIKYFFGEDLYISKAEGFEVFERLNTYSETQKEFLPELYDVLNCHEGCNEGPASLHNENIFEIEKVMEDKKRSIIENQKGKKEHFESLIDSFNKELELKDFIREYQITKNEFPQINDDDILNAFTLLGKNTEELQNINCGACGSDTCHNMARKIALGVNIPLNCMVKNMDSAKEEHVLNIGMLEQFETIWKNVESGIAVVDAENYKVLDVNPAAERMFGSTRDNMLDRTCQSVFCPATECRCRSLPPDQGIGRSEREFRKIDGTVIPIIKSVARIHYKNRPAFLESFTDISYLREAEQQKHMLEIAEQASKAKSSFLANMSHEIRTPMNAIIGMTSIGMSAEEIDRKNYCFDRIDDASKHLLGIINDILDMSKIEAGKFELSPTEFNFEKMLKRVVNVNNIRVTEKKQNFTIHIDNKIPKTLYGDEQRLAQVITNLVGNAVKFTPEGGFIRIKTNYFGEEDGLCIIKISVTDSGIGISPEQQNNLFKSFQQAESSTARKFGGTGLGLAISKNIVEMMGGGIWIESELGKGATFAFTIKAKRVEDKQKDLPNWSNARFLVVDDDQATREYFIEIMQGFGTSCDTASSGEEALRLIVRNDPYDIYFVDWRLPGIDGMELTETLKAQKAGSKKAAVVMMSAVEWNVIEEEAKKVGVDKFLNKPLFPSAIANIINECLGMNLQQAEKAQQTSLDFTGYRILLAEDVDINREILYTLLEPTHLGIDSAENGIEAVRMFIAAPEKYGMIFMDVQMPEMDGHEATRRIRAFEAEQRANAKNVPEHPSELELAEHSPQQLERPKGIPIVAMTANVFREDIEKCIESGMNDHVGKPLNLDEVTAKLVKYLRLF